MSDYVFASSRNGWRPKKYNTVSKCLIAITKNPVNIDDERTVMDAIVLRIPCVPAGQPRGRAGVLNGHARVYNPTTVGEGSSKRPHPAVEFKASIRHAVGEGYTGPPLQGPIRVDVEAVFPRPKSKVWKRRPMPRLYHTAKPDRDNLDKCCLDALTQSGMIGDDCQVCVGLVEKYIAAGGERPHVVIRIVPLAFEPAN